MSGARNEFLGTPLTGDWTDEMCAALLVELMHKLDMRSGYLIGDQVAFASPERAAWITTQVEVLLEENTVSRARLGTLNIEARSASKHVAAIEVAHEVANACIHSLVTYASDRLRLQDADPVAVVEEILSKAKEAHVQLDEISDGVTKCLADLYEIEKALP